MIFGSPFGGGIHSGTRLDRYRSLNLGSRRGGYGSLDLRRRSDRIHQLYVDRTGWDELFGRFDGVIDQLGESSLDIQVFDAPTHGHSLADRLAPCSGNAILAAKDPEQRPQRAACDLRGAAHIDRRADAR